MNVTVLAPIAVATPPYCARQDEAALNAQRLPGMKAPLAKRIPAIHKLSGIEKRYTCLKEYAQEPGAEVFEPHAWPVSPYSTTRERNKAYREHSIPLALRCGDDAIRLADIDRATITHVIVTSCTGFFAPGLDIKIVEGLRLDPSVNRTLIGFMGCYAAFNALRVADSFCRANSNACVLIVCLELCSLHFRVDNTLESIAVNSIFADGCASVIMRPMDTDDPAASGHVSYEGNYSTLHSCSSDMLTWDIGDHGYIMGLSNDVPDVLAQIAPGYVDDFLSQIEIGRSDIQHWAIHPGGRRIVEAVQESLHLCDCEVADSLAILRDYGNMSSPTILFVLRRILSEARQTHGERTLAMAFGPGLTIEGAIFRAL